MYSYFNYNPEDFLYLNPNPNSNSNLNSNLNLNLNQNETTYINPMFDYNPINHPYLLTPRMILNNEIQELNYYSRMNTLDFIENLFIIRRLLPNPFFNINRRNTENIFNFNQNNNENNNENDGVNIELLPFDSFVDMPPLEDVETPVQIKNLNENTQIKLFTKNSITPHCIICIEDFKENDIIRELSCDHFFHQKCIDKWFESNKKCPLCRNEI